MQQILPQGAAEKPRGQRQPWAQGGHCGQTALGGGGLACRPWHTQEAGATTHGLSTTHRVPTSSHAALRPRPTPKTHSARVHAHPLPGTASSGAHTQSAHVSRAHEPIGPAHRWHGSCSGPRRAPASHSRVCRGGSAHPPGTRRSWRCPEAAGLGARGGRGRASQDRATALASAGSGAGWGLVGMETTHSVHVDSMESTHSVHVDSRALLPSDGPSQSSRSPVPRQCGDVGTLPGPAVTLR